MPLKKRQGNEFTFLDRESRPRVEYLTFFVPKMTRKTLDAEKQRLWEIYTCATHRVTYEVALPATESYDFETRPG